MLPPLLVLDWPARYDIDLLTSFIHWPEARPCVVDSRLDTFEPLWISKFVLEQIRELSGGEAISGDTEELTNLERGSERRLS